jgi:signal transduction histidine kinase/CheY-like chemotaxis protein
MRLNHALLAATCAAASSLAVVCGLVVAGSFTDAVSAIEREHASEQMHLVQHALDSEKDDLNRYARAWATGEVTNRFMERPWQGASALVPSQASMISSDVDVLRLHDTDGVTRLSMERDGAYGAAAFLPLVLPREDRRWAASLNPADPKMFMAPTADGFALVALEPVRRRLDAGAHGTLVAVRLLDAETLGRIRALTGVAFEVRPLTFTPAGFEGPLGRGEVQTLALSADQLSAFAFLVDPDTRAPLALLELTAPRTALQLSISAITKAGLVGLLFGLVIVGATVMFGRRFILQPLANLTQSALNAERDGIFCAPGVMQRRDELGELGRAFERAWDTLQARSRQLDAARRHAESANEAKSSFLAAMSHEIRTPLNGVLGMAHGLRATTLAPRQAEMVDVIVDSGEALLAVLNDILDLAKVEAGRVEIESIPFDVEDLAIGAQALFTLKAHQKNLSFAVEIDPSARRSFQGDPTRIRQVLYNLLSNAVKFTETGEVRVRVWAEAHANGAARLFWQVRDTGIGMSAETQSRLFSKFVQADSSTTRRFGGSGLGLALSRGLVELMDGRITVESAPGEGATFTFSVVVEPCAAVHTPAPRAEDLTPLTAPDDGPGEGLRILAAEDNPVNQLVLRTLLAQIGIEVTIVDNGQLAVEAWQQGMFDLVLMDVQMPVCDGPTATREIRRLEAEGGLHRTPIIALTANAMAHQVEAYLAAGMDGHVAKPIRPDELFRELLSAAARGGAVEHAA